MPARLGQHFLIDEGVRDAVVAAAHLEPKSRVLEIGPGRGILTRSLVEASDHVTAVEMDERLAARLKETFAGQHKLKVIESDFLKLDLETLGHGPYTVVANLPYSVGAPILQKILVWPHWTRAVLMFQKEVAERITAAPEGPDYGLLTLSVLIRAEAEMLLEVPRDRFRPAPQVSSAVVGLMRRPTPLVSGEKEKLFFRVAKAAFEQRRKMAAGVLSRTLHIPKEKVEAAFAFLEIPPNARAQDIPYEDYLRLPEVLF